MQKKFSEMESKELFGLIAAHENQMDGDAFSPSVMRDCGLAMDELENRGLTDRIEYSYMDSLIGILKARGWELSKNPNPNLVYFAMFEELGYK